MASAKVSLCAKFEFLLPENEQAEIVLVGGSVSAVRSLMQCELIGEEGWGGGGRRCSLVLQPHHIV